MDWLNAPFVLLLLAGLGYLYRQEHERRMAAERQLSDRKYDAYGSLLDIFFDVLKSSKTGIPPDPEELQRRFMDVSKDLIVYGSDAVVRAFQQMVRPANQDPKAVLRNWGEVMVAIRKDMGNANTTIKPDDVLKQFINDYEDAKAKGLL